MYLKKNIKKNEKEKRKHHNYSKKKKPKQITFNNVIKYRTFLR